MGRGTPTHTLKGQHGYNGHVVGLLSLLCGASTGYKGGFTAFCQQPPAKAPQEPRSAWLPAASCQELFQGRTGPPPEWEEGRAAFPLPSPAQRISRRDPPLQQPSRREKPRKAFRGLLSRVAERAVRLRPRVAGSDPRPRPRQGGRGEGRSAGSSGPSRRPAGQTPARRFSTRSGAGRRRGWRAEGAASPPGAFLRPESRPARPGPARLLRRAALWSAGRLRRGRPSSLNGRPASAPWTAPAGAVGSPGSAVSSGGAGGQRRAPRPPCPVCGGWRGLGSGLPTPDGLQGRGGCWRALRRWQEARPPAGEPVGWLVLVLAASSGEYLRPVSPSEPRGGRAALGGSARPYRRAEGESAPPPPPPFAWLVLAARAP